MATTPSNAASEIFDDDFRAEMIVLAPLDATARARAFEAFPFTFSLAAGAVDAGLLSPLEVVLAAPSGKHTVRTLDDVPIAVVVSPEEGGTHRLTLREVAHNRWHGGIDFDVDGDPA